MVSLAILYKKDPLSAPESNLNGIFVRSFPTNVFFFVRLDLIFDLFIYLYS